MFGFEGSSVERTEPTGYQFAAQSKEDSVEEAAASSAAEEAAVRAAREDEVS